MYGIVPTTAENIIGAVDACGQYHDGADSAFVALFLDIPTDQAQNALTMAKQLELCELSGGKYKPTAPFSPYLITSEENQRAVIFRMVLEQYIPFQTFKNRLRITGLIPKAAEQTKIIHGLTAHRDEIGNTFTNLGQYSGSLIYEGAGLYKVSQGELSAHELMEAVDGMETAKQVVFEKLGQEASTFANPNDVIQQLTIAVCQIGKDKRSPIVHAANAVESFLVQIAQKHNVSINGANGINAKADRLNGANKLSKILYNMSKYLGHLRNAADHGTNIEINAMWNISFECAKEYVHVAVTFIKAVVDFENGEYTI